MRKILICALVVFGLQASAQNTFTVKGNISNAEGKKVVLYFGKQLEPQSDSAIIKGGTLSLTESIPTKYSSIYLVFGDEKDQYGRPVKYLGGYADAGATVTIDGDLQDIANAKVNGGKTQTENNEYEAFVAPITKITNKLNNEYETAPSHEAADSIRTLLAPYGDFTQAAMKCFVKTHPDSYVSADKMIGLMGDMTYDEIKAIYDSFTDNVKQNAPACDEIRTELATLAKVQRGAPAPDFTATDINGKPFTLSSLKGKVVVIDFWASWCVPCRKSNPHMLELYKKYHDKGLDMVYVSDDDSNPDKWRKAVEKDSLIGDGFHHVLRGMKWDRSKGLAGIDHTNDISDKYAIHYLPTKYLIGSDGNIICKINEGEEEKLDLWLGYLLK